MIDGLLQLFGLQRIPKQQSDVEQPKKKKLERNLRCEFKPRINRLIQHINAVNNLWSSYRVEIDGYDFYFKKDLWVDFVIEHQDLWIAKSRLGDNYEYNVIYLADDDAEAWGNLVRTIDRAIEKVIRDEEQRIANKTMDEMLKI